MPLTRIHLIVKPALLVLAGLLALFWGQTAHAKVWAERVLEKESQQPSARIAEMYETAFARRPSPRETAAALAFLDAQQQFYGGEDDRRAWSDLCHVLLNTKEFIFVR